ncbi:MAG: S49 family peptidase, partial [Rhodothermales bacterium]
MEQSFLQQLLSDRRELLDLARSIRSAEQMREMRREFMESLPEINVTPRTEEEIRASYLVDSEGTAHIPITGELTSRAETDICGAYTAEALTEYGYIEMASLAADEDDRVERIVYHIDSPGGYADGVMDAANAMRAVSKPTEARVGAMAASAAYWLASQTDRITANSVASRVGSIGVAVEEYDMTQALENAGITRRVYTSTDAPDKRPDTRTEEGQAKIVAQLDDLHRVFARSVAEGRGTTEDEVNQNYGRGSILIAERALAAGMIDEIKTVPARAAQETAESEPRES